MVFIDIKCQFVLTGYTNNKKGKKIDPEREKEGEKINWFVGDNNL
jgi:hypothetical protein